MVTGLFFFSTAEAQQVAGFGYRLPGRAITAAPGQTMSVSIFGVNGRFSEPVLGLPGLNGLPTELRGISLDFVQGPLTIQLPIRAIQQSSCPATGACSPATTITTQIPFEMNPDSPDAPLLRIRESGLRVAEVAITAVTDSIHILNTCDQIGVWIGVATDLAPGRCFPVVAHANAQLVTAENPAKVGETLIAWVYGLGAISNPVPAICCASPDQFPLAIQPLTITLSYAGPGRVPLQRFSNILPTYAGLSGPGAYQVHFVVNAPSTGLSPCSTKQGNLKVLLAGPSSADSAEICVQ